MLNELNWEKIDGLMPAIVQDAFDGRVLMLGYMNRAALERTQACGRVTFWSRSRQTLWTKGETSGHFLELVEVRTDCDRDTLLVRARPLGPTCHLGSPSCFDGQTAARPELAFLAQLEDLIRRRDEERPQDSYTTRLLESGVQRMAQKVGEEGVETALAATAGDPKELLNEAADLLFHLLVLLRSRELELHELVDTLESRHA